MARHKKRGIEYFSLDCNFFSNRKIKILKSRYGADGITIFIYLLCEIYKNGYYIIVDDDFYYIVSDDLNMNSDKVKQVLTFLLERSMFDKQLFQSDAVLTSAGIQERFQLAVKTRAKKNPIKVDRFWLLNEEETEPFIKVTHFEDNSENNTDNSKKNNDNSREESIKESKVKESKGEENKELPPSAPPKGKEEEWKEDSASLPIPGYAFNTMTHNYSGLIDTLKRLSVTDTGEVNSILKLSDYGRKGTTVWKLIANTCWSDIGAKGRYLIAALNKAKRR